MNIGIYRLVYNTTRGIWMAVGEHVRSHQSGKNGSGKARKQSKRISLNILILGISLAGSVKVSFADPLLPANTIPTGLSVVNGTINMNTAPLGLNGAQLNINQITQKGILQGTNFNIGSASAVNFNHLGGSGSGTLVRITGDRSVIAGALNSPNGSVYLINQNGILFANGARVNVNGLVASALDLKDADFLSEQGHLTQAFLNTGLAAYNWGGDADGFQTVLVQVEPDAQIKAALGSSVLLFAPKVINQGSIETTEGQVAMAAGEKVYLSYAPELNKLTAGTFDYADDSAYKGLAGVLVEVDSYQLKPDEIDTTKPNAPTELFGEVTNDTMGRILAQRGNVTMSSFLVNQNGRVTATSSATLKGSVRLLARDTRTLDSDELVYQDANAVQFSDRLTVGNEQIPNTLITASRNGKLSFGEKSVTAILAEDKAATYKVNELFSAPQIGEPLRAGEKSYYDKVLAAVNVTGTTISDDQIFNPPVLEAIGRQVVINDEAKIVVPGGFVNISAQRGQLFNADNLGNQFTIADAESRIYLGKNTLVDAAGLKNVAVDLNRNFVEVLLTQTDLKDNPINKDAFLDRERVVFDIRNTPDSRVADLDGFVRQVPRSVGEKLAEGGAVKLQSEGDVIQRAGSKIDVSGGSLLFNSGIRRETWLVAVDGKSYAIGEAPPDTLFLGFLGNSNVREIQETGYTEGKGSRLVNGKQLNAADSENQAVALQIDAYNIALDGQLKGGAIYGERQRDTGNLMGQLSVNVLVPTDVTEPNINIGQTVKLADDFTATSALSADRVNTVELDAGMLSRSGFEDIQLKTDGNAQINGALNLVNGAKFDLTARDIQVNQNIVARSGEISLTSNFNVGTVAADNTNITVANRVKLDVSGNWINDTNGALPIGRIQENGGKVSINSADEVTLGAGSVVDVSGGGWLHNVGSRQVITNGDGGSIDIATQVGQGAPDNPFTYVAPQLNGELRGFALGAGGDLSISAPFITVGNSGLNDAREFLVTPEFFQDSGFASFNLTGRDGVLVRSNTNVNVVAKNYQLNSNYRLQKTGAHVHGFAMPTLLPAFNRASTSLTLATQSALGNSVPDAFAASGVSRGSVVVETGANIKVDSNGVRTADDGAQIVPTIALSAWDNQIVVDGTLEALGGDISLTMNGNPSLTSDNGYNDAQAIWLGENARLNASGHTVLAPNNVNQRIGTVYDGGHVTIDAKKGFVVAKAGSEIDVSGTSAILDVRNTTQITPTRISSNGGAVSVVAREGILLDSSFDASSPGGLAGSLDVRLTRGITTGLGLIESPYPGSVAENGNPGNAPDQLWYIDVAQSGTFVPDTLQIGDAVQPAASGVAKVSADAITAGGFSDVALQSEYGVRFTGEVDLTASRSLNLNARMIEATPDAKVTLNAPQVVIGNTEDSFIDAAGESNALRPSSQYFAPTAVAGTAQITVNAQLAELNGSFALSGFANSTINSNGDIRLNGISDPNALDGAVRQPPAGTLLTTGTLDLNARQVYPTTLTNYTISVSGDGSTVNINKIQTNASYDKVLSAGGTLNINAETINQNGVLLAPFGTIALNATDALNLNAGSVTSVSAQNALIPFGFTQQDGQNYLYDFGPQNLVLNAAPERDVKLNAPNLNQNADSTMDISGGGDLFAYEFVPGLGGSSDVLAADANQQAFGQNATDTWVIMPNNNQTFASFDPQYWQGSNIKAGDAVYISGAPGVAAGYYTLLPARYALLPGAVLVSAVSGSQDRTAGLTQTLINGSTLVSGHLAAYTSNGYAQTTRTGGFIVRSGADAYQLAEYNTTTASRFFAGNTQAQQTIDAGRLSISASESLVLQGILTANKLQSGLGAEVDIAAPNLFVVGAGEQTGQVDLNGIDYLAIDETTLANFNAASLLLGGTRSNNNVNVVSTEVRLSGNANVAGSEVILAATDTVKLDSGANLAATGAGATAKNLTIGSVENNVDGDGALVRVSTGNVATVTRVNVDADRGDLIVDAGATLATTGSILLDASKSTSLNGAIDFADGAALAFSSGRVSLGAPTNGEAVTDGLWLQATQLAEFTTAGSLSLNSQSTIDIYGDATFGNNDFDLTLQSAGIAGYQNDGQTATITAQNLTIANNNNAVFSPATPLSNGTVPTLGSGNLVIQAETVNAGNNTVRLAGYDQIDINASKEIVAAGNAARTLNTAPANQLLADKNLTLSAPRITTANQADYAFKAGNLEAGLLKIQGTVGAQPTNLTTPQTQGSRLSLSGDQVILAGGTTQVSNTADRHAAAIVVKGGQVTVNATGALATDNVTLENGASIDVGGTEFVINDQTVALPAGTVALQSANGDVDVQTGALVDVSAVANGDAGRFIASATNGDIKLAGTIKAAAVGAAGKNATASVDAKSISNVSQVFTALANFASEQIFRVREGDITIGASDKITAKNVKVNVDQGAITVNGTIDASGDKGGNIELYAKNDVTLNRGAQLLAKGLANTTSTAGSLGNGGDVTLSSDVGVVRTVATDGGGLSGALIDVSGDQAGAVKGEGGEVYFRAARTGAGAGDGVNVDSQVAAAVTGAKWVSIGATKQYEFTNVGTAQQNTIRTDTNNFVANVNAQLASFSQTRDGLAPNINPIIQINSNTDLTLSSNWIFADTIPSGGELVLRATGDLIINGNLDYEQFTAYNPFAVNLPVLTQRQQTWNYRLIAGADNNAVNPESVNQGVGDIVFASGRFARTGTGFIHAVAGNHVDLASAGGGASIYTVGLPDNTRPNDFTYLNNIQAREFYGDGGGDVNISAGGNIVGSENIALNQRVSSWLTQAVNNQSSLNPQARWFARYSAGTGTNISNRFTNGIGTLGGGDVNINAGGGLSNLQVAAASNGRMTGATNEAPDSQNLIELGGGDVNIAATGSVNQVLLHTGKGGINVKTDGDLSTSLALMDSQVRLQANNNLEIVNANNPTSFTSSVSAATAVKFYSYSDESFINALSLTGDVGVRSTDGASYPSSLTAVAPNGDIEINSATLFPSSTGGATLLSGKDINIDNLIISEVNPASLPVVTTAFLNNITPSPVLGNFVGANGHTAGLLHLNDSEPVRIYAKNDVSFRQLDPDGERTLIISSPLISPKSVQIKAGNDIINPTLVVQNLNANDVSTIEAGRNIFYTDEGALTGELKVTSGGIQVAGPGRLHVVAGQDIDLGTSEGIRSVGDLYNPFLTPEGADILVQAGAKAETDFAAVINAYVAPGSIYSSIYLPQLTELMRKRTGNGALTAIQALADFRMLDKSAQTAFINKVYFAELKASGLDAINVNSNNFGDYSRAQRAILTLFPTFAQPETMQTLLATNGSLMTGFGNIANEAIPNPGNLSLFYSQIKSESGGAIELLTPGGLASVGLAVPGDLPKADSDLGIISLRGGELNGFARNDFLVNTSRIFTLGGSNLFLFSALNDIDAGKGSKTASGTPPPLITIVDGKVTFDFSSAVTGSGIGSFVATGGEPGDVDLFAPYGEINAGEAGIRSAGNVNLGARVIIGADNISAGGVTTGAPVASTAGIGLTAPASADPTAQNKQGNELADSAKTENNQLAALPSLITVEVISLGDESVPAKSESKPCSAEDKTKKDCQP